MAALKAGWVRKMTFSGIQMGLKVRLECASSSGAGMEMNACCKKAANHAHCCP